MCIRDRNHEIRIEGALTDTTRFVARFAETHRAIYGYVLDDHPVEVVNCRIQAIGKVGQRLLPVPDPGGTLAQALVDERDVYLDPQNGWRRLPVYRRSLIPHGVAFSGPAIVEELTSTAFILPGQAGNCLLYTSRCV